MDQPQYPNLVHGQAAEQAAPPQTAAEVETRKASTFAVGEVRIVKDRDERVLRLCQIEMAELSAALGHTILSSDLSAYQAKRGGIVAGLARVIQRLEGIEPPA